MTESQAPTIGRIVHYRLSAHDVEQIRRRRTDSQSILKRMRVTPPAWPAGAQAHVGNDPHDGDLSPMMIVAVWSSGPPYSVNGQVFLDGNDVLWVTSVLMGEQPGAWMWPART